MIVWAVKRYGWSPAEVRRQSWRDLMLLAESYAPV